MPALLLLLLLSIETLISFGPWHSVSFYCRIDAPECSGARREVRCIYYWFRYIILVLCNDKYLTLLSRQIRWDFDWSVAFFPFFFDALSPLLQPHPPSRRKDTTIPRLYQQNFHFPPWTLQAGSQQQDRHRCKLCCLSFPSCKVDKKPNVYWEPPGKTIASYMLGIVLAYHLDLLRYVPSTFSSISASWLAGYIGN